MPVYVVIVQEYDDSTIVAAGTDREVLLPLADAALAGLRESYPRQSSSDWIGVSIQTWENGEFVGQEFL